MRSRVSLYSLIYLLSLMASATVSAFHDGGVASCNGCHTSHNSQDGTTVGPGSGGAQLIAESASDVCLMCHAENHGAVLGIDPLNPPPEHGAGNFVFLLEDNINDGADGLINPIPGETAGHNVVAPGRGLEPDIRNSTAPGGTFPSAELGCTSCHDPHGTDQFRLLRGVGSHMGGLFTFSAAAPIAIGLPVDGAAESNINHTAYVDGMSEWCGNCHGWFHTGPGTTFRHPRGLGLGGNASSQYNAYDGDANPAGGNAGTAYLASVPFEDPATLVTSTSGPNRWSSLMCVTCHRAHASSAPYALRWDPNVVNLADDGLVSGSYPVPNPYPDPNQGTLCSKCHDNVAQQLTEEFRVQFQRGVVSPNAFDGR